MGVALQRMADLALRVDHHRGAGVGGAHHRAAKLQRPHARDVQVLVDGHGVAKPADVAQVHKHGGRGGRVGKARAQLFAKQVLIANIGRQDGRVNKPQKSGKSGCLTTNGH